MGGLGGRAVAELIALRSGAIIPGELAAGTSGRESYLWGLSMVRIARIGTLVLAALTAGAAISSAPAGATVRPHHHAPVVQSTAGCTSASYNLTIALTSPSNQTTTVAVTGAVDFASTAATADITIPANFPLSALAGTTEDIVLVDGTLYLAVPPAWSSFVGGASWVSLSTPPALSGVVATVDHSLASWCGNASSITSFLYSNGGSISSLGTSVINGVAVTGTQVTIGARGLASLAKVIHRFDPRIASQARGATINVDVWSSSQDGLVELSATAIGLNSRLGLQDVAAKVDLSDVNEPVSITAPTGAVPFSPEMLKGLARLWPSGAASPG